MKAQIIEQIEKIMQLHLSEAQMQLLHKTLNAIIPDAETTLTEEKQPDYEDSARSPRHGGQSQSSAQEHSRAD